VDGGQSPFGLGVFALGRPDAAAAPARAAGRRLARGASSVVGNTILLTVPETPLDKTTTSKYQAQIPPNGRLAGLITRDLSERPAAARAVCFRRGVAAEGASRADATADEPVAVEAVGLLLGRTAALRLPTGHAPRERPRRAAVPRHLGSRAAR